MVHTHIHTTQSVWKQTIGDTDAHIQKRALWPDDKVVNANWNDNRLNFNWNNPDNQNANSGPRSEIIAKSSTRRRA